MSILDRFRRQKEEPAKFDTDNIPALVRHIRQGILNLNRKQFAAQLGVSYSTVRAWETSEQGVPLDRLMTMANLACKKITITLEDEHGIS